MHQPRDINARIIDALYCEALVLADEVRAAFDLMPANGDPACDPACDPARLALSGEGLKTTMRIMHVLAWLLNQRAFLAGEMSPWQLHRLGGLPADRPADPALAPLLPAPIRDLIARTERLHARVARIERQWSSQRPSRPQAVARLREGLQDALRHF